MRIISKILIRDNSTMLRNQSSYNLIQTISEKNPAVRTDIEWWMELCSEYIAQASNYKSTNLFPNPYRYVELIKNSFRELECKKENRAVHKTLEKLLSATADDEKQSDKVIPYVKSFAMLFPEYFSQLTFPSTINELPITDSDIKLILENIITPPLDTTLRDKIAAENFAEGKKHIERNEEWDAKFERVPTDDYQALTMEEKVNNYYKKIIPTDDQMYASKYSEKNREEMHRFLHQIKDAISEPVKKDFVNALLSKLKKSNSLEIIAAIEALGELNDFIPESQHTNVIDALILKLNEKEYATLSLISLSKLNKIIKDKKQIIIDASNKFCDEYYSLTNWIWKHSPDLWLSGVSLLMNDAQLDKLVDTILTAFDTYLAEGNDWGLIGICRGLSAVKQALPKLKKTDLFKRMMSSINAMPKPTDAFDYVRNDLKSVFDLLISMLEQLDNDFDRTALMPCLFNRRAYLLIPKNTTLIALFRQYYSHCDDAEKNAVVDGIMDASLCYNPQIGPDAQVLDLIRDLIPAQKKTDLLKNTLDKARVNISESFGLMILKYLTSWLDQPLRQDTIDFLIENVKDRLRSSWSFRYSFHTTINFDSVTILLKLRKFISITQKQNLLRILLEALEQKDENYRYYPVIVLGQLAPLFAQTQYNKLIIKKLYQNCFADKEISLHDTGKYILVGQFACASLAQVAELSDLNDKASIAVKLLDGINGKFSPLVRIAAFNTLPTMLDVVPENYFNMLIQYSVSMLTLDEPKIANDIIATCLILHHTKSAIPENLYETIFENLLKNINNDSENLISNIASHTLCALALELVNTKSQHPIVKHVVTKLCETGDNAIPTLKIFLSGLPTTQKKYALYCVVPDFLKTLDKNSLYRSEILSLMSDLIKQTEIPSFAKQEVGENKARVLSCS